MNYLALQSLVGERTMKLMETHKATQHDFISNMPDNVVTDILNRLPLRDAVRTSILSKYWRFKWTMLSQLVFDQMFLGYLVKGKGENKYGRIISRLLLHLKGVITKFVIYMYAQFTVLDDEDINHWMLFLSSKGIKDITFCNAYGSPLKLPAHLLSCLELTRLELHNCRFHPPASFHGFPSLLSLDLSAVVVKTGKFGKFFTKFPVLEILNIRSPYHIGLDQSSKVKLADIARLTNIKILNLFLCNLDDTTITSSCTIFNLVGFLPKLQELHLDFYKCKTFTEDGATKRSIFHSLKSLKLSNIDLDNGVMFSFAFEIIKSSQNLHNLEIKVCKQDGVAPPTTCSLEAADYNTMEMLQLRSVVFKDLKSSENEVCLIKYLLACSPFLKEIVIHPDSALYSIEKLRFAKKLLKLDRASPVAKIDLL